MLIRWATAEERECFGYGNNLGKYDVLVAVDRMSGDIIGLLDLSRENKRTGSPRIFNAEKGGEAADRLHRCAENQINPKGGSFHYRYPEYAREADEIFCPCCNNEPMPEGVDDLTELDYSWVMSEKEAQGCLFGKCCVVSKKHNVLFYDMPQEDMAHFMTDVQKAAMALHAVTGAVKINYEIHGNSGAHLHCHLFPRYLDDAFPSAPIDYRLTKPSPYDSEDEFRWFIEQMRLRLR